MSLADRLVSLAQAVGADIKTLNAAIAAGVKIGNKALASATEQLGSVTINDDNSATGSWPNRLEFLFKPFGGTATLVSWFNEYGEFRVTPGKVNTVGIRIFTKTNTGDANHTGNVFEVQDNRNDRNVMFGIDGSGNVVSAGTITRAVPNGPTLQTGYLKTTIGAGLPSGTPANILIVRT